MKVRCNYSMIITKEKGYTKYMKCEIAVMEEIEWNQHLNQDLLPSLADQM